MISKDEHKHINLAFYTLDLFSSGVLKIISTLSLNMPSNYNIHIIVSDFYPEFLYPTFPLGGKIKYLNIPKPKNKNILTKIRKNYIRKKLLKKYKLENNIDITLTFSENPNINNVITKCNNKSIISVHSYMSRTITDGNKNKFYTFFYKFMIKRFFNKADKVITVSNGVKHDLINQFNIKENLIHVLYNPLDIDRIVSLSKEKLDPKFDTLFNDSFTIINIARICHAKGHWNLIRAFSLVQKHISKAKLLIIGDADQIMGTLIKKLITDLHLENNVYLLGYQANPYNFLKKADVFAFSSISEGFGISIVEALACSIPVISTDCKSGPREILAPSTDFLRSTDKIEYGEYGILTPASKQGYLDSTVPITSEEIFLSKGIIELSQNKNTYSEYSKKGLNRALTFKTNTIISNYDNLFKETLEL